MSNFNCFNLDTKIEKILTEIGFNEPTPIQQQAIPKVLQGLDLIACAQTGTGKTAAFMLPILDLLSQPDYREGPGPHVLILVPTRELAMQVAEEAKKFGKYVSKVKTVCIYGGVPYPPQRRALASRYEILVATPGRLMDHMEQNRIDLSRVKLFVLDEADRMLDMGFLQAVEHISQAIPKTRQTLLFSATIDKKIIPISQKLQNKPFEIRIDPVQNLKENIEQKLYYVDGIHHKMRLLEHILANTEIHQSIIFTTTIVQANRLATHLYEMGYASEALHGDMNQRQRSRTIAKLRGGSIKLLIATDVAARGIDVSSLSHVINFDLPFQAEDFIHRIGRTGRAGAKGTAISFSTYSEDPKLNRIQQLIGGPIQQFTVEGLLPKPKPIEAKRQSRRVGGKRFHPAGKREPGKFNFSSKATGDKFKPNAKKAGETFNPGVKREHGKSHPAAQRKSRFPRKNSFTS